MQLFDIKADFSGAFRALDSLPEQVGGRAMASAVNKTLAQARTAMIREITSEFNLPTSYVRDKLRVRNATSRRGVAQIVGELAAFNKRGRSMNIIRFVERMVTLAALSKRTKAGTRNLLHVKIKRRGETKPVKGAFIGNKGRTVFERVGRERLPIKPVQVIDVAQMFNTKRINKRVLALISARFPAIFAHEASYFLDRFNRGQ